MKKYKSKYQRIIKVRERFLVQAEELLQKAVSEKEKIIEEIKNKKEIIYEIIS